MINEGLALVRDFVLILFRRLGQPVVLNYLVAGLLIGPFMCSISLIQGVETVRLHADLGIVLLLFGLGLEFGWSRTRDIGFHRVLCLLHAG